MKRPGDDKITNTDEQEVAVNQSAKDVNGYDEPVSHAVPTESGNQNPEQKSGKEEKKKTDQQPRHYKAN
ncbi:MAG TPA: hypothetical protein VD884_07825 [Ohtaekwangia sp.]|nr:hypothetical protein [Ohtaekwangia sp.]